MKVNFIFQFFERDITLLNCIFPCVQQQKLEKLGRAKMLIKEEFERKESSQSSAQDSDSDDEIGPKAHMSLLDQHSKQKV